MQRILKLSEVEEITGLKRTSIYALMKKNDFPQSLQLTGHAVGWMQAEVAGWIEQRAASRQVLTPQQ